MGILKRRETSGSRRYFIKGNGRHQTSQCKLETK